jgi:hypothetical protein
MPCNAIAVATGQVALNLARELDGLGAEAVAQALLALLRQRFAHLGEPELISLYLGHSSISARGIGIRVGEVLIHISPEWTLTANTRGRARAKDQQTVEQVRDAVTNLLTGLGGLVLQKRTAQAIRDAGYRVTGETCAANGALVLNVEL